MLYSGVPHVTTPTYTPPLVNVITHSDNSSRSDAKTFDLSLIDLASVNSYHGSTKPLRHLSQETETSARIHFQMQ